MINDELYTEKYVGYQNTKIHAANPEIYIQNNVECRDIWRFDTVMDISRYTEENF